MTVKHTLIALLVGLFAMGSVQAEQEELTQEEAIQMVFGSLNDEEKKELLGTLQHALDESIHEAEEAIRENGTVAPYAYLLSASGGGQFVRTEQREDLAPEMRAYGIQRGIVQAALDGGLVASVLYMTMASPKDLGQTATDIEEELSVDRSMEDVRLLAVEMQHLAGVGMLHLVPYWENDDGDWVFGEPQEQIVPPQLQQVVRQAYEEQGVAQ